MIYFTKALQVINIISYSYLSSHFLINDAIDNFF